jgi:3-hydroxyacyl-CoA dehydrogenase
MVKAGLLGRKTGRGFFRYEPGSDQPAATGVSDQARALIERHVPPATPAADQHLVAGLVLPLVLEATRLLAEGRARSPDQIDLASVFGIGFPRARGGPLYWTDGWGAPAVVELLEPFADLSPRYRPTPGLLDMAAGGRRFFDAAAS